MFYTDLSDNSSSKSIGGTLASPPVSPLISSLCFHYLPTDGIQTPEEDQAERDKFDLKVYNACQQMSNFHAAELKRLGVPFFGVSSSLIIANDLQQTTAARDPLSKALITQEELMGLQRKMVQYLEDMYKD
jgi:hypothetical protein